MVAKILAGVAFALGIFGLVHQWFITGGLFDWSQFLHHEPLIACCFVATIALVVGEYIGRRY